MDFDTNKKNVSDFALWIKAPKEHIMQWDSFFGKCYPGWHLECSAMGYKYLGDEFDIHTGGIDHIPTLAKAGDRRNCRFGAACNDNAVPLADLFFSL